MSASSTGACQGRSAYDPADMLLPRLDGVQNAGKGWRTRCPAHGGRSRSLSITPTDSGSLLVHCFAGCSVHDVLGAVGLKIGDLFPLRDLRSLSPEQRREIRRAAAVPKWAAALDVLCLEASVLLMAATQLDEGRALHPDDLERLRVSALRIFDAQEVLRAR